MLSNRLDRFVYLFDSHLADTKGSTSIFPHNIRTMRIDVVSNRFNCFIFARQRSKILQTGEIFRLRELFMLALQHDHLSDANHE